MHVRFSLRPFDLTVEHSTKERSTPRYFRPFELPDTLYRRAARRAIAELIRENRRLRHRPGHRAGLLTTMLAEAFALWLRRRGEGVG